MAAEVTERRVFVEVGQRFDRGVVTETEIRVGRRSLRGARLRCDCGAEYTAPIYDLVGGRTRSCGCLVGERSRSHMKLAHVVNTRHGLADHPLYPTWRNMIERCENPANHNYARYGGRGIRVCDRWHDLAVFVADIERWLGPKPPDMTLDRICGNHDYRLDNVRWATATTQNRNLRTTKLTAGQVREIRDLWFAGGFTQREIAAQYGVGQTRVSLIVNYKAWADL